MTFNIPRLSLADILAGHTLTAIYLVVMYVQIVAVEGYGVSPVKVGLMGLAPLIFLLKVPYISKALWLGMSYWALCYFSATFNGEMRFSTIGYLGMFVMTFIVFYQLIHTNALSFQNFYHLLKVLIIAYGAVLVLQQLCILVGLRSLWMINLNNQFFLSINKLPSLSLEPSHSARLLTVMMLCYLRCIEIANDGIKPTWKRLFEKEYRLVTILFLWSMLTMGSGTAFIGLGILSLYFIERKTVVFIVPALCVLFYIGQALELEQMKRAVIVSQATMTGDAKAVWEADGSAASRVVPLINTFTKTDLTDRKTWFGKGTAKKEKKWRPNMDGKLGVIDQYGLISFIVSLILVYTCIIRRFLSIETLLFLILFGVSLGNIAYTWGAVMLLAASRYFQVKYEMVV